MSEYNNSGECVQTCTCNAHGLSWPTHTYLHNHIPRVLGVGTCNVCGLIRPTHTCTTTSQEYLERAHVIRVAKMASVANTLQPLVFDSCRVKV